MCIDMYLLYLISLHEPRKFSYGHFNPEPRTTILTLRVNM